jgi:hypothetical protein
MNLAALEIEKNWMLSHGYIKNDFDVHEWAAPEFAEAALKQLVDEAVEKVSRERLSRDKPRPGSLESIEGTCHPAKKWFIIKN